MRKHDLKKKKKEGTDRPTKTTAQVTKEKETA